MIGILARRNLTLRPWRSVLLLGGFGLGVGVMIVLLAIGEAMLTQARDERLVGGGDITVLPEGIDVEVMKTGGVGGLFFSINNARFLALQLLSSVRDSARVRAVAPQIADKVLYLRTANGREIPVRATGELPSRSATVGAVPPIAEGAWSDDDFDRRWRAPVLNELRADIDHFHLPPRDAANRDSWAEWHYFNVLSADRRRWMFLSYIVGGDVPAGPARRHADRARLRAGEADPRRDPRSVVRVGQVAALGAGAGRPGEALPGRRPGRRRAVGSATRRRVASRGL